MTAIYLFTVVPFAAPQRDFSPKGKVGQGGDSASDKQGTLGNNVPKVPPHERDKEANHATCAFGVDSFSGERFSRVVLLESKYL
jgi:hypothetical protein